MKFLHQIHNTGISLVAIFLMAALFSISCTPSGREGPEGGNMGETEYFTAENREAVQAISYGFRPWYEDENRLPGGVVEIEPSGDTTGVTDHNSIQEAVDRMSQAGGGKVLLKDAKYYVINQIMMKSNVILRGAGMGKTVVRNTRTKGESASWNVVMIGLHHPAFMTRGKEDVYRKVKFGSVNAGSNRFTLLDGIYDDVVFTPRDNRKYWDQYKPGVGDMLLLTDYEHGRDGMGYPWPATHHWGQFARITAIDGYTVSLDEPFVMDLGSGVAHWIPSPAPFNARANLPYWWLDNCVVGDMEFENVAAMIMGFVGVRNALLENIKSVKTRGPGIGIQIQGFYKSTMQGCYVEWGGGRSIEIKSCSGRSLIKGNKFINVGSHSPRPAIALGESVYAIHIQDNEWYFKVAPHPDTWTFCMPQQYGGSFKRNYVHTADGVEFPSSGRFPEAYPGIRETSTSIFRIKGGTPTYTYLDSTYQLYRNIGFMVWEGNRYEINAGIAYDFFSTDVDKTRTYWMRGALIKDEDFTGSVFTLPAAAIIRNGYPSRPEDAVLVENVKNLMGREIAWLAGDPATSFPRLIADKDDPEQMVSVTTDADLATNPLINDPLIRVDGMIVKIKGMAYSWDRSENRWENLDDGSYIIPEE